MITQELQKKIDRSIKLLQSVAKGYDGEIEVAYSGGKDSDVILQLAKECGIKYRAIYKMTTIDPPGTIQHVKDMGVEVLRPKYNFYQLMEKMGQPTRMRRYCCTWLKEYKVLDRAIIGVRREESPKRAKRYNEPTQCRVYGNKDRVEQIYPILDWTEDDIAQFGDDRGIKFAPVYYDEDGKFHPERRLGCMGCPLMSKNKRIESFKMYPNMVKLYIRGIRRYMELHPESAVAKKYNCYEAFARDVFFQDQSKWEEANQRGLFGGKPDWKKHIEQHFNIRL